MIIDAPPGTGDVTIDLKNIVPTAEAIIVTTPHLAASDVATKAGIAVRKLKQSIIGVVENMAYYENPSTGKRNIYSAGAAARPSRKNLIASSSRKSPSGSRKNISLFTNPRRKTERNSSNLLLTLSLLKVKPAL